VSAERARIIQPTMRQQHERDPDGYDSRATHSLDARQHCLPNSTADGTYAASITADEASARPLLPLIAMRRPDTLTYFEARAGPGHNGLSGIATNIWEDTAETYRFSVLAVGA